MIQWNLPVFGICGWSGSGKTTLIEEVIHRLTPRRLRIAVIKHDVHGLNIDRPGKDSDRFFNGGADAILTGPDQSFIRLHLTDETSLHNILPLVAPFYDIILVEGHKSTPVPNKIWLKKTADELCPPEADDVRHVMGPNDDRARIAIGIIDSMLENMRYSAPLYAGVLIGGQSSRMGGPKHLITESGSTWLERTVATARPFVNDVILLGEAAAPAALAGMTVLPDAMHGAGPISGMLSAMRWQPFASWLFLACDLPKLSAQAIEWLLSTRAPGIWASVPKSPDTDLLEPLFAHYDFRARHLLEQCDRPSDIARFTKVMTPTVPEHLAEAWLNVNTPDDLAKLSGH
jgi:molybdopterin-guanine dinucleotide biosynthesis protein MobB